MNNAQKLFALSMLLLVGVLLAAVMKVKSEADAAVQEAQAQVQAQVQNLQQELADAQSQTQALAEVAAKAQAEVEAMAKAASDDAADVVYDDAAETERMLDALADQIIKQRKEEAAKARAKALLAKKAQCFKSAIANISKEMKRGAYGTWITDVQLERGECRSLTLTRNGEEDSSAMFGLVEKVLSRQIQKHQMLVEGAEDYVEITLLTPAEQDRAKWEAQQDRKIEQAKEQQAKLLRTLAELQLTKRKLQAEQYQAPSPKVKAKAKAKATARKVRSLERQLQTLKSKLQTLITAKRVSGGELQVVSIED